MQNEIDTTENQSETCLETKRNPTTTKAHIEEKKIYGKKKTNGTNPIKIFSYTRSSVSGSDASRANEMTSEKIFETDIVEIVCTKYNSACVRCVVVKSLLLFCSRVTSIFLGCVVTLFMCKTIIKLVFLSFILSFTIQPENSCIMYFIGHC